MKKNTILNTLIALLIIALVFVASFEIYKGYKLKEVAKQAEIEASKSRIPNDENSINLLDGTLFSLEDPVGDVFLSYEKFLKNSTKTSYHVGETSVTYRFSKPVVAGGKDSYMLNFKMRADVESAIVKVRFGIEHEYYVTTQWRDYYIPCKKGDIDSIKIQLETPFQKIYLTDLNVVKYDSFQTNYLKLKNGSYAVEKFEQISIDENSSLGIGEAMDVACDGEFLYSVGNEKLTISHITDGVTKTISTVDGIGNARHLELKDDKILAIASREAGVYLVNIEDKFNPYVISYYDSLEIANDITFSGDFMFVAGRYFGVEFVDISDISNPVYIGKITNNKECFRITVDKNHLFVSCWATHEVEVYDISVIEQPVLVTSIGVDGRCAEAYVKDSIIYIASGYHHNSNASEAGDAGYATGNGVAIYDITDIKHPKWITTIKTEGGLYGNGYDDWSLDVSNGFLYFTNSFGGIYIYDINVLNAPKAVLNAVVKIPYGSENFLDFSKNTKYIYPFDETKEIHSPVMGVCVSEGKVFVAGAYTDVYSLNFENSKFVSEEKESFEFTRGEQKTDHNTENYHVFLENSDVYALVKQNENYIVATSDGLILTDTDFSVKHKYATPLPVRDVKLSSDGYIVTAETDGIGIYAVENNTIQSVSYAKSNMENRLVSSVGITGDGNFVITQSSWTKYEPFDIRDKYNPYPLTQVERADGIMVSLGTGGNTGTMYYRNIVSGTVDGTVGLGGGSKMLWFRSIGDRLKVENAYTNKFGSEINGSAVLKNGKEIISIYNNGYVIYNPLEITEKTIAEVVRLYIPNVRLKGKISVRDDVLVVSNAPACEVFVVNMNEETGSYLAEYCQLRESPGIALIEDDFILVPVRHGGIMQIPVKD